MDTEENIQKMLNEIIEQLRIIITDNSKQSFGSLEHLLNHILKYRNEKLYLSNNWIINTPRWLGEYGNTLEEDEVSSEINKLQLYIAENLKGGWGK